MACLTLTAQGGKIDATHAAAAEGNEKKNAQTSQSEERPMTAPSRRALPSTLHALLALLALAVLRTPAAAAAERAPHPLPAPNADMDMCILTGTVFMYSTADCGSQF